ncbi:hypothetical protein GIS00_15215 [Nakamurella sp. YIM 132087]|uniref:Signal peptidase I n=1 Tax=Nakamurella alba TaxID=2665158 RepID=A0A7K1FMB0_9ACTN|nr:LamG-like jellyroll fold domain-containing protein [Nakamurella alba]MTD15291.1 hypothetical protein [Nakamurella alba]
MKAVGTSPRALAGGSSRPRAAEGGTGRRPWWRRVSPAALIAGAALVLVVLAGAGWRLSGGDWQIVSTPSMGEAAPVGTLLLTRPAEAGEVHVGDIVTYQPPVAGASLHTHRVVSIDENGGLHTRGDINSADDPWALGTSDLIGVVVARLWGIGWIFRALPILVIGTAVLWFVTARWIDPVRRMPLRIVGSSVIVGIVAVLYRPFVGLQGMGSVTDASGTHVTMVSTGLLPIRVKADTGGSITLVDGQVGTLTTHPASSADAVHLSSEIHLPWWGWVLLVILWLSPLWWALGAGSPPAAPKDRNRRDRNGSGPGAGSDNAVETELRAQEIREIIAAHHREHTRHTAVVNAPTRRRHWGIRGTVTAGAATTLAAAVLLVPVATAGAFAGTVTNTTNTAASAPYFQCRSSYAAVGQSSTFFTWPIDYTNSLLSATDASGNNRVGAFNGTIVSSTSRPCPRDTTTTTAQFTSTTSPGYVSTGLLTAAVANPLVFSEEIWFRTTQAGGRLMGFSASRTGQSTQYDRHVFLNNSGQVVFGVYPSAVKVVVSPLAYNDGNWHHMVATLSGSGTANPGMRLYMDGALVASDPTTFTAENTTGFWRVGWDNLTSWGVNMPTQFAFIGNVAWASVYTVALTPTQVAQHYNSGK